MKSSFYKFTLGTLTSILVCFSLWAQSQCDSSWAHIQMNVTTDAWGYETYWEIVPGDSSCGQGTLYWGSNSGVGCDGNPSTGGYPSNTIIQVDSICLQTDSIYNLIFVDSYGDGGLTFEIFVDGAYYGSYTGSGSGNTWIIDPSNSPFPPNDSPCSAVELIAGGPEVELVTTGAGIQINEPSPAGGACGTPGLWCEGGISNTAWAKFTAQANVSYQITTCNTGPGFDTQLAIYRVENCFDFGTYELVAANDDTPVGCSTANGYSSLVTVSCLEEGQIYYVQLDGYYGEYGTAYLTLTEVEVSNALQLAATSINCPLNKGEVPNGAIYPYFTAGSLDFSTTWTGPNGFSSIENTINALSPGIYECTAIDACGDTYTATAEITQPQAWNIAISSLSPQCDSAANGEINITVSGATGPYSYAWSGPDNAIYTAEDLTGLVPGSYQVVVTDDNDCIRNQNINLPASNNFTFSIGTDTTICTDSPLTLAGPPNCTYNWSTGDSSAMIDLQGNMFSIGNHIIILTATNENHCVYSDAIDLEVVECNVGVSNIHSNGIHVFPNPSNGSFRISLAADQFLNDVEIFDGMGKLVFTAQQLYSGLTIHAPLPSGIYQLRAKLAEKYVSIPLVIN
jgi:hypothetical protein